MQNLLFEEFPMPEVGKLQYYNKYKFQFQLPGKILKIRGKLRYRLKWAEATRNAKKCASKTCLRLRIVNDH